MALHAKELIRQYRRQYKAQQLHLILACPTGFALSLGQQLNAVGKIMAYERTENGSYQASVRLASPQAHRAFILFIAIFVAREIGTVARFRCQLLVKPGRVASRLWSQS